MLPEGKVEAVEQEKQKGPDRGHGGGMVSMTRRPWLPPMWGLPWAAAPTSLWSRGDVVLVGSGVVPLVSAIKLSRATMRKNPAKSVLGLFLQLHRDRSRRSVS